MKTEIEYQSRFSRLPKWAQEEFKRLERERETAINTLNDYLDNQTESPIYYDEMICLGEGGRAPTTKRRYIQHHKVVFESAGVALTVSIFEGEFKLSWEGVDRTLKHIAFVPTGYQQAQLIAKENMR